MYEGLYNEMVITFSLPTENHNNNHNKVILILIKAMSQQFNRRNYFNFNL